MNCSQIAQDLRDEQQSLDEIVAGLDNLQWALPTSSVPWTVADQIGHLAYFDNAASLAIANPTAFAEDVNRLWAATSDAETVDDLSLREYRALGTDLSLAGTGSRSHSTRSACRPVGHLLPRQRREEARRLQGRHALSGPTASSTAIVMAAFVLRFRSLIL